MKVVFSTFFREELRTTSEQCRPFPYLLYYVIEGDALYVLGLAHERSHTDYLKRQLGR